jgi:DNA repair photolyase
MTPRARVATPEGDTTGRLETNVRAEVEPIEERCSSLLRANDAADLPYAVAVNPYRGCALGCVFCPAALTSEAASCAIDSPAAGATDTRHHLRAKVNAAERLREELGRPRYQPRPINLGSATEAYQPAERRLRLTRGILETLLGTGQPVAIVTRSTGIARDVDLLKAMAAQQQVLVMISLCTLDEELARLLEPHAPTPTQRLATMRRLSRAGIPVTLNLAPVVPGLTDAGIEEMVAAAALRGATSVRHQVLTLSRSCLARLTQAVHRHDPLQAEAILSLVHDLCRGADDFGTGAAANPAAGSWSRQIAERVFDVASTHGLATDLPVLSTQAFRPPVMVASEAWQRTRLVDPLQAIAPRHHPSQSSLF